MKPLNMLNQEKHRKYKYELEKMSACTCPLICFPQAAFCIYRQLYVSPCVFFNEV